jgi:hypothetical protein
MEEKSTEKVSESSPRRRHRRRTKNAVVGGIVLLFAAVGAIICLVKVVGFGVTTISEFAAPKENAAFYENYLTYIVGLDPQPYKGVSNANPDWMLKAAAWAAVSDDKNGSYGVTADSRMTVPSADITKYYEKYFGDSVRPVFHTFTDNGITFEYSSVLKCFYVPKNAIIYVSTPKVTSISRSGNVVMLTVQYLPKSFRTTAGTSSTAAPAPTKTMIYVLKGGNGSYYIDSIAHSVSAASSSSAASSK